MFNTSQLANDDLDILVRTALTHGKLDPDITAAIETYRAKSGLTAVEQRQLEILDNAIADGCIVSIQAAGEIPGCRA